MIKTKRFLLIVQIVVFGLCLNASPKVTVPQEVQKILERYCTDCHGAKKKKGDVRLHDIANLEKDFQSHLLNKIEEQLFIEAMPPKDEDQLSQKELKQISDWLEIQYKQLNEASKFRAKLKTPAFGNYVNHEDLFSGKYKDLKGYTADRRWLINQFIFSEKINKVLGYKSSRKQGRKSLRVSGSRYRGSANLVNPFLLPSGSGVRYYDNTMLNGGHLLSMISNAKEVSKFLMSENSLRSIPTIYPLIKLEYDLHNTLKSRKRFLEENISELMQTIYKDENESYLPQFTSLNMKAAKMTKDRKNYILPNGKTVKKVGHDPAAPRKEYPSIKKAIAKFYIEGQKREELIRLCEKEWFEEGVSVLKIKTRLDFMLNYMDDILRRSKIKPNQYKPKKFSEDELQLYKEMLLKHRKKGDVHNAVMKRCLDEWSKNFESKLNALGEPTNAELIEVIKYLFVRTLDRKASEVEVRDHLSLLRTYLNSVSTKKAISKLIESLILRSEFVYRHEFGTGSPDKHGRNMMSPRDASFALAYALTDSAPDKELLKAVEEGRLNTREDYKREVVRMLKRRDVYYVIDERIAANRNGITTTPIRKLRFFREFFGYANFPEIFKDDKRLGAAYNRTKFLLLEECDRLVDHIISKDKNVFEELLTSDKYYVYHSGDNKQMKKASDDIKSRYEYFKNLDWENFSDKQMLEHRDFIRKSGISTFRYDKHAQRVKGHIREVMLRNKNGKTPDPYGSKLANTRGNSRLGSVSIVRYFGIDPLEWDYPTTQPASLPNRKGILSHPAWLMAFSQNTHTDPVLRGKWIREKLLAGTIPDIPITVEAVVPEDHHKTFRTRLAKVTEAKYCWRCHKSMNPLGYTFEMFDDFGRFRTEESLEHPDNLIKENPSKGSDYTDLTDKYKTKKVNTIGYLKGTGDDKLDGEVNNAMELVERLAKSDRVRQSIIRHAFRYFLGRNEILSDSKTLIDADDAYVKSDGSFDAVIISLLTSDSFIYSKKIKE
jgi:hypothetical protein